MSTLKINFSKSPTAKSKEQFTAFDIADLTVDFEDFDLTIDGDAVDAEGIRYIIGYGLQQALADSYAAETTYDKAWPKFNKRLVAIIEGDMVFGSGNRSGDPVATTMRELARDIVFELKSESGETREKFAKRVGKAQRTAWLSKVLEQVGDNLRERAEAIVAQKAKSDVQVTLD